MSANLKLDFGIMKMNIKQIFTSRNFYYAFAGIIILFFLTMAEASVRVGDYLDAVSVFDMSFQAAFFTRLIMILTAFPAVTGFCSDWNTQYIKLIAGRTGVKRYAWFKAISCIFSTFATAVLSFSAFILLLLVKYPFAVDYTVQNFRCIAPFGSVIAISPILYIIMKIICYASYCALWSSFGIAFSAYIPNRFVACAIPLLMSYVAEVITSGRNVPMFLQLQLISTCAMASPPFGKISIDFLYINGLFLGAAFLVSLLFINGVERRMRNELV